MAASNGTARSATMFQYVFHYDLENPDVCLRAAPVLAEIHRRHEVPATFFMLGTVLEQRGADLRRIFGEDPLFDIQSHTYSHRMLRDNRMHGPGVSIEELHKEIGWGKRWVEEIFEMTEECRIVSLMIAYLRQRGVPTTTYRALYERYAASPETVPGRDAWTWEAERPRGPLTVAG